MSDIKYKLADLPPLSEADKAHLRDLAARPDSEIDTSDIPPLDEGFWQKARPLREVLAERARERELKALLAKTIRPELMRLIEQKAEHDGDVSQLLANALEEYLATH